MIRTQFHTISILFLLSIAGGLVGCRRPAEKPTDVALAGVWRLEEKSVPLAVRRIGRAPKDSKIVFMPDGRLLAVDMPMEDPFQKPKYRLFTGEGRWRLEDQNGWMLTLTIERGGYPLFFGDGGGSPKVAYTFVDGPDSGERWTWRKEK